MTRYDNRNERKPRRTHKKKKSGLFSMALLMISCITALLAFGWYFYADMGKELTMLPYVLGEAFASEPTAVKEITADIMASNACVVELESGAVIYTKAYEEQIAPASTAKLLTALTVLDYSGPDEIVTAGPEIWRIAADASRAWLNEGDMLTVRQLLRAMLLPSGNDAAYTAAVYTGRKILGGDASEQQALDAFLAAMNQKAAALGAQSSSFTTPDGYDADGQYTTAADLVRIAKACLGNETVMDIVGDYSVYDVWKSGREVTLTNTNELLNPDSAYFYSNAIGLKTGSSVSAGNCLISAAVIDGRTYISVVMGSGEGERFSDTLTLYSRIESQSGGYAA